MAKFKLVTAMLIFGTTGILVKYVPLSSDMIALARGSIGTLFLFLIILLSKKTISRAAIKNNISILLVSGVALGVNWILLFEAYKNTSVATATLCYYLAPVFVIVLSPFILKETLTLSKGICVITTLVGIAFVSGVLQSNTGDELGLTGIIFGVAAAIFYACMILMNKFLKDISSDSSTLVQLAVASLVLLPYTLLTEKTLNLSFAIPTVLLLMIVGVVHTGIAYYLYFSSIKDLKGQTVAIFSYIDPVAAIVLSAVMLKETMNIYNIIGAILILGSTLVSEVVENTKIKA